MLLRSALFMFQTLAGSGMVVQYCRGSEFLFQSNWWKGKKKKMRAWWDSCNMPGLCNLSLAWLGQTLCVHTHTHCAHTLHCNLGCVIEGAFERPFHLQLQLPPGQPCKAGLAGGLDLVTFPIAVSGEPAAYPGGACPRGRGWSWRWVVARPPHACSRLSLSPFTAPKLPPLYRGCWCQFTLGGYGTKAHAGSSHFRMRIINLTPCIERSQCQGTAINSTSCSGALEGKREGGSGGLEAFFSSPNLWEQIL